MTVLFLLTRKQLMVLLPRLMTMFLLMLKRLKLITEWLVTLMIPLLKKNLLNRPKRPSPFRSRFSAG
jgi:hypothetical protein